MNRYYDFKIKRKLQLELTRATLTIDQNILNKVNSGSLYNFNVNKCIIW